METCFESKLNRVMPNGTLRGVRGRGNYSIFLPTRFIALSTLEGAYQIKVESLISLFEDLWNVVLDVFQFIHNISYRSC